MRNSTIKKNSSPARWKSTSLNWPIGHDKRHNLERIRPVVLRLAGFRGYRRLEANESPAQSRSEGRQPKDLFSALGEGTSPTGKRCSNNSSEPLIGSKGGRSDKRAVMAGCRAGNL
ncbi:hypothetical protein J6590_067711 [Homalodisca vitripennis]|nr:hypothetical protein J6590_067711 [Homalodisca vitripennis]